MQIERKADVTLLAVFGPLVVKVVSNPHKFPHKNLQQSAMLCLTKLMCVSAGMSPFAVLRCVA